MCGPRAGRKTRQRGAGQGGFGANDQAPVLNRDDGLQQRHTLARHLCHLYSIHRGGQCVCPRARNHEDVVPNPDAHKDSGPTEDILLNHASLRECI